MGVWRTVKGRHIYIEDGEDLHTAMKKSGKFNNEKPKADNKTKEQKLAELEKKKQETQGFIQRGAIQEEIDMLKDDFTGTKEEWRAKVSAEQEKRLKEYQKEKEQRINEFKKENNETEDYRMTHRPTETGVTADNLINQSVESPLPEDAYEHPEYYASGSKDGKPWLEETMQQLNSVRGNPEGEVTIYRATPGDKINKGDWITLSKSYAETHNESQLDGKGNILEQKVKARDIQFAGDVLEEWGYFPRSAEPETKAPKLKSLDSIIAYYEKRGYSKETARKMAQKQINMRKGK